MLEGQTKLFKPESIEKAAGGKSGEMVILNDRACRKWGTLEEIGR